MEEIKKFLHEMKDEVEGAEKYYKCYLKYKEENPSWANEYLALAAQEMSHYDKIQNIANQYVAKHPEAKAIFDFCIEWMFENITAIKSKLRA